MFHLIVAGSRNFRDFELMKSKLDFLLQNKQSNRVIIVSGGARGADKLAEKYAKLRGLKIKVYQANWNKFGKRAGYLRNEEMAKVADACVTFWDGHSSGTKHMIDLAQKYGLKLRVVRY